ncbi:hypothetical protein NST99_33125 [Paenibacillus sp. FSL L8-0470]
MNSSTLGVPSHNDEGTPFFILMKELEIVLNGQGYMTALVILL